MKRIARFGALLLVSMLLFSCATSVGIGYTDPSEIDMGRYRNIGIASTVPFEGFLRPSGYISVLDDAARLKFGFMFSNYDYFLKDQVASYATQRLVGTIEGTDHFNVTRPKKVDAILEMSKYQDVRDLFKQQKMDAVIIPKIESMAVNEYIYSQSGEKTVKDAAGNEKKEPYTDYFYSSRIAMVYSYVIIDTQTERIVARRSFPLKSDYSVQISSPEFTYSIRDSFARLIDSVQRDIVNQLVPQERVIYETLMDNKPEIPGLDKAYDAVDEGMYASAFTLFHDEWKSSRHLPSGYNAALLLASAGRYDDAVALLEEVLRSYPSSRDASYMKAKLEELSRRNAIGQGQFSGAGPGAFEDAYSNVYGSILTE